MGWFIKAKVSMSDVEQGAGCVFCTEQIGKELPVHWFPGAPLPAQLHTGNAEIDFEHAHLLGCMNSLRCLCHNLARQEDCSSCLVETRAHCEGELVSLLGDLLAFILDHFKTEEDVMRQSMLLMVDRELCQAHMEDHANISAKVQEIIVALQPLRTVYLLRELDVLLQRWIANHVLFHDVMVERWLESRC